MDKSDCECDDAYFEQTMAAAQICDPINSHPAGHHLVQNGLPNHAGESCSLIQNHQAEIVSSANEHMMLAPTLSADDLINAVNRHRYVLTVLFIQDNQTFTFHIKTGLLSART